MSEWLNEELGIPAVIYTVCWKYTDGWWTQVELDSRNAAIEWCEEMISMWDIIEVHAYEQAPVVFWSEYENG